MHSNRGGVTMPFFRGKRLYLFAWVKIFLGFQKPTQSLRSLMPLAYALHVDTPPVKYTTHKTYMALPLSKYLQPVYSGKQIYFQLFFCILHLILLACRLCNFYLDKCCLIGSEWNNFYSQPLWVELHSFWLRNLYNIIRKEFGKVTEMKKEKR